jgi:hypothetical protein
MNVKISAIGFGEFNQHGIGRALQLFIQSKGKIKWLCSNIHIRQEKVEIISEKYNIDTKDIKIYD